MMGGRRDGPLMRYGSHSARTSGIAIAIAIGVLLGFVVAFLYPRNNHQKRPLVKFDSQDDSTGSEQSERLTLLKSEFAVASAKNYELKKQIRELNEKLQMAKQGREKAGPYSTVKGQRTNPTVIPDESVNPRLAKILEQVSLKKELIVVLATSTVKEMLEVWFTSLKRVGVANYLIVALDDNIARFCESHNVPFYRKDPEEGGGESFWKTGGHHPVSGLKYRIIREFLQLGYSVLVSDVDVVYLQNPFEHLYRDSDVEAMSDGHDNSTAYGHNAVFDDPTMGWARYTHTMRVWAYSSGFFYIRPTIPSIELLDRVTSRLIKENVCDQAVMNEELFYPSNPGYTALHASKRTMDLYHFMNSKVLFKKVRKSASLMKFRPVVVHINYHRDKLQRMNAVLDYYLNAKLDALRAFPDGSG